MQHLGNPGKKQFQSGSHENQLDIMRDVTACCSVMDDTSGIGSNSPERMNMLALDASGQGMCICDTLPR